MIQYLAGNPRTARAAHKFGMGSAETVARARQAYQRYQAHFKVPSEP